MIGASLPPGPGPVATAVAPPEHAAATAEAGAASHADGNATKSVDPSRSASPGKGSGGRDTAQVDAATQRDAAAQDRKAGDDAPPRDFAGLLAANGAIETTTDTATKAMAADPDATEPPATNALPDQLLALLSGSWATTAKPASTPTAPASATPGGNASSLTPQLPAARTAGALPLAASAPAPAATEAGDSFAALAKLATDAIAAAGTADRPGAQGADATSPADNLAPGTTAPLTPPVRASVLAPAVALAMPANPDAGFDDGFGARIAWMAEQRIGHAEIRLNPEHVGPIDVRVQLDGNRVTAEFHSAHLEVRRAIEASMPQLREMLGQHGLQLGHADVGQRPPQGQSASQGGFADAAGEHDGDDGIARKPSIAPTRNRGLLDEYA